MKRAILGLAVFMVFAACAAAQTSAQGPAAAQPKAASVNDASSMPSKAELRGLIRTLEDEAERKQLIARLNALLAARPAEQTPEARKSFGARLLEAMSVRIDAASRQLGAATRTIMDLPRLYDWARRQASDGTQRARWAEIAWKLLLALLAGLIGEWAIRRLLARPGVRLESREAGSVAARIVAGVTRTVLDLIPIAGFLAASYAALSLLQPGEQSRLVALALIGAIVWTRTIIAVARLFLAPSAPRLRLLRLPDIDANYVYIWIRRFANVAVSGYFTIVALRLVGLPPGAADVLFKALGLLVALMFIIFTLQNRTAVADALRGGGESGAALSGLRARLAEIWHVLIILAVVAMFGAWLLQIEGGFEYILKGSLFTLIILVAARLATGGLHRLARRVFALKADLRRRYPGLEARANRYLPILEHAVTAVVAIVALFALFEGWGIDSLSWLATPLGERVTGSIVTIALLLVMAVLVLELASAAIERYLSREGAAAGARARTLLPLLRTTLMVVVATIFVLVSLSELGVDIAPLLAGAGIVGLAVGFGAQTLMKDIITGIFLLMEDQMAVGDVVKVGSHSGVVEQLTLRTIRLRDLAGTVHVIPFSEVTTLENMTKDYSRYVFDVRVAYREDTDQVVEALRAIGEEMRQDPAYRDLILEPLEILGVDGFADNAVVIKARITTQPIKQWTVGREFNRRMKKRFDALGIEIPFPHRTIYFGQDRSGEAAPARIAMENGAAPSSAD